MRAISYGEEGRGPKSMRAGILTFQNVDNYGATLQAYALASALGDLGAEVEIINYSNQTLDKATRLVKVGERPSRDMIAKVVSRFIKHQHFKSFDKRQLKLSGRVHDYAGLKQLSQSYEAVIVGSDQVWNDEITGGDRAFYLDFVGNCTARYSYAASFGGDEDTASSVAELHGDDLSYFQKISLREAVGMRSISSASGVETRQDVDPVLLLDSKQWNQVAAARPLKEPYVFMYLVAPEINIRHFAESYAAHNTLKLIDNKKSMEFLLRCGPEDFISWIANADAVITNSFHGTAFSLIFQKEAFFELGGRRGNRRARSLLKEVGLTGREILSPEVSRIPAPIDWESVTSSLESMREDSLAYLRGIVGEDGKR